MLVRINLKTSTRRTALVAIIYLMKNTGSQFFTDLNDKVLILVILEHPNHAFFYINLLNAHFLLQNKRKIIKSKMSTSKLFDEKI